MTDQVPSPTTLTTLSILKSISAYDETASTDDQFFPSEDQSQFPSITQRGIATDPMEDDYDDPDGGVFDGPVARSVPTSMSAFRMRARSKGELDRLSRDLNRARGEEEEEVGESKSVRSRKSSIARSSRRKNNRSRRGSDATSIATSETGESGTESTRAGGSTKSSKRRRSTRATTSSRRAASPGSSEEEERPSFFQGISDVLRGRRPSIARYGSNGSTPASRAGSTRPRSSRRKSRDDATTDDEAVSIQSGTEGENDDEDPYGPYGSSDTTSSETTTSSSSNDDGPRRRRGGGGFFGMPGAGDAVFGESRIDFIREDDSGEEDDSQSPLTGRKGSPNAHQALYILDEDLPLHFIGLRVSTVKSAVWKVGCGLSLGGLWLLGRWVPRVWLRSVGRPGEFDKASYIVVEVSLALSLAVYFRN